MLTARMRDSRIHLDMLPGPYHESDALGSSGLKLMARSPWHLKNRAPMAQTRAMFCGTLVHCAQLEPNVMAKRYVVTPEDAPKYPTPAQWGAKKSNESSMADKAWWTAFEASCVGREIVSAKEYSITQEQLAAVAANETLAEVFATRRPASSARPAGTGFIRSSPAWSTSLT
jgi:exodeoxyribonuclease VIII